MFVHMTSIRMALGEIARLRKIVTETFLPLAYEQPGFLRAYLLEQVDDPEHAQLILVWESQSMHERFRSSQAAGQFFEALNRRLGWHTQSQSYIVRLKPDEVLPEEPTPTQVEAQSGR